MEKETCFGPKMKTHTTFINELLIQTDLGVLLWAIADIAVCLFYDDVMSNDYGCLPSSTLIVMSHQTSLQAVLHFYPSHWGNESFWLAFDIESRSAEVVVYC